MEIASGEFTMTELDNKKTNFYALLIGIDAKSSKICGKRGKSQDN
jgi:hypothetical protein